jgi:hypothetical protein
MVRLHKEYGLNPTISQCILCGKEKNEIALLGAGYKGEAPMRMVTSIEPCDRCKKKFLTKGTMLVEARQDEHGHVIPTGRVSVVKDAAYRKMTNIPAPKKVVFIEPDAYERLGLTRLSEKKLKKLRDVS